MSKPATLALAVVSAIALLAILGLTANNHSEPARPNGPDRVADPAPTEPTSEPPIASAAPDPPTPAAAVAPALPQAPTEPALGKPLDEQAQLEQLHDLAASDPPRSLKLAREAVEQFPNSSNAPEFEWNVVKALFNMNDLQAAEDEARLMAAKYPDSHFTGDVVHHLLNHPPNPSDVQDPPDAEVH